VFSSFAWQARFRSEDCSRRHHSDDRGRRCDSLSLSPGCLLLSHHQHLLQHHLLFHELLVDEDVTAGHLPLG
jgi:hypothetical protein